MPLDQCTGFDIVQYGKTDNAANADDTKLAKDCGTILAQNMDSGRPETLNKHTKHVSNESEWECNKEKAASLANRMGTVSKFDLIRFEALQVNHDRPCDTANSSSIEKILPLKEWPVNEDAFLYHVHKIIGFWHDAPTTRGFDSRVQLDRIESQPAG